MKRVQTDTLPAVHAPAAYLASLAASKDLCCALDPGFDATDRAGGLRRASTEHELRAQVLEAASWDRGSLPL